MDLIFNSTQTLNTTQLPLVGSPLPVFGLILAYLYFVLKWGPDYMKQRAPYSLRSVLIVYNFTQIFINAALSLYWAYVVLYKRPYNLGCCHQLPHEHPMKSIEIKLMYIFYLIKIFDFLDTIFFVLRKSNKQITFLHVYHHVIVVLSGYGYQRIYGSGGQMISIGILNSGIHGIMYAYYLLATLNASSRISIWWKKHITHLQMLQFLLVFLHNLYPLVLRPDCPMPKFWLYYFMTQSIVMLALFSRFYKRAYLKKIK